MDGAKHITDTPEALIMSVLVGRRGFCTEAFSKERVERDPMRILVVVRSDCSENEQRRKSKVSLALSFNQGLVGA